MSGAKVQISGQKTKFLIRYLLCRYDKSTGKIPKNGLIKLKRIVCAQINSLFIVRISLFLCNFAAQFEITRIIFTNLK